MDRRRFLHTSLGLSACVAGIGSTCYGFFEAGWVKIDRQQLTLPRLPESFRNTTIAFVTDLHHGPYLDIEAVEDIVRTVNLLNPDLILLGGDYSLRDRRYIRPCFDVLKCLRCPMGVYGVLGNHDYWHGIRETHEGFAASRITPLTNSGVWFEKGGDRLRVGGVDDLWAGRPELAPALGGATPADACLLVSHNPDYAETLRDRRVGLVLSGHTHGGQVILPGCGSPWVPSRYGQKYLHGRVEAPATNVYVSRGLGVSGVPVRMGSRPEINLITLI